MAERGQPRLLLVERGADPPECSDAREDWLRLPVSSADRDARIRTLESRLADPGLTATRLQPDGTLEYRGERTHLSAVQAQLIGLLLEQFGAVVGREALVAAAWPGTEQSENNLDVAIGRLRRRLTPLGLRLRTVRSRGYLLTDEPTH